MNCGLVIRVRLDCESVPIDVERLECLRMSSAASIPMSSIGCEESAPIKWPSVICMATTGAGVAVGTRITAAVAIVRREPRRNRISSIVR